MNFNIYIDDQLGNRLIEVAKESQKSRNALIREAIGLWLNTQEKSTWPEAVMDFEGIDHFPAFEAYRKDLAPVSEDPFA